MITQELLNRFFDKNEPRGYLRAPWSDGDFIYATNGHYGVRVVGAVEGIEAVPKTATHPDMESLFKKNGIGIGVLTPADLIEVPPLPEFEACDTCHGSGHGPMDDCEDCEGMGSFWHGNYEYDCQECEGEGSNFVAGQGNHTCPDCFGIGENFLPVRGVPIGHSKFQAPYLRIVSQLPDVRLSPGPEANSALRFFFSGGCGLLMPLQP